MERRTHRKSPRLAEKLKKAVQHLHVDVFGYESKVTGNIAEYFSGLSQKTGIPKDRLLLRIFRDGDTIRIGVYHQGRLVKRISVGELITLLTHTEPSDFFGLEGKVLHKIKVFMKELAATNRIAIGQLQVCITCGEEKVCVKAYQGTIHKGDVPLRVLIQHFMK